MVKTTMEDARARIELQQLKGAVIHVKKRLHVSHNWSVMILDETARIPSLEDGKQYKFLGHAWKSDTGR